MDDLSYLFREEALQHRRSKLPGGIEVQRRFSVGMWSGAVLITVVLLFIGVCFVPIPTERYWPIEVRRQADAVVVSIAGMPTFQLSGVDPRCNIALHMNSRKGTFETFSAEELRHGVPRSLASLLLKSDGPIKGYVSVDAGYMTLPQALFSNRRARPDLGELSSCVPSSR